MFDYAKIRLKGRAYRRALRTHPALKWHARSPADRWWPLNATHAATWKVWTFYAKRGQVAEMRGSFHQHHHNGTNWQDFTHPQFVTVVNDLCDTFGLFAGAMRLENLEVGVNITPPGSPESVIHSVLFHRTAIAMPMEAPARGVTIAHGDRYRFKVYDKGHQFPEAAPLLRVEVHFDRMEDLHEIGIHTVLDLLDPAKWIAARDLLLQLLDEVFIAQPDVCCSRMRPTQRALIQNAGSVAFWMKQNPKKRSRKRETVERLYRLHCSAPLKVALLATAKAKADRVTRAGGTRPVGGDN